MTQPVESFSHTAALTSQRRQRMSISSRSSSSTLSFVRNTMSKEVVKLVEQGGAPWLTIEKGHLTEVSKKAADEVFLKLGGKVFFPNVQPMSGYPKGENVESGFFCPADSEIFSPGSTQKYFPLRLRSNFEPTRKSFSAISFRSLSGSLRSLSDLSQKTLSESLRSLSELLLTAATVPTAGTRKLCPNAWG